jgi:HK97 family phage prohead protease
MKKMPMKTNREYRDMTLAIAEREEDVEENEEKRVEGYATTFNEPYVLYEDDDMVYREQVDPSAFDNTDMSDVIMQYDHEGRVFARTNNNTLTVTPDEKGLYISADLGGTELGRGLFEEIRGGYTDKMSFGFIVDKDEEMRTDAEDGRVDILRTITGISKLFDVSAVSIPANNGTSIGATTRGLIDGAIDKIRAERLEAERIALMKRRTEIRARALGKEINND